MLVTAATGLFAPAIATLLERGDRVVALTRGVRTLPPHPRLRVAVADLADVASVRHALGAGPRSDDALIYAPYAGDDVRQALRAAVTGRMVELFTSRWAEPVDDEPPVEPAHLPSVGIPVLLGWTMSAGRSRWHTPAEISTAALAALASGRATRLGTLRPWADRPR